MGVEGEMKGLIWMAGGARMIGDAEFDLREQLARMDRSLAETEKLQEEARKYAAETRRLNREDRYFGCRSYRAARSPP